jgi:DNA-directed RNA polymerase subunit RPC12/RpoP
MLQCKKCFTQIFINNSEDDHGDTVIVCSQCGAKNVLGPTLVDTVQLYNSLRVVGYKD